MNLHSLFEHEIKKNGGRLRTLRLIELEWSKPFNVKANTNVWSFEEEAQLIEMYNNKQKVKDIAIDLDRTPQSIKSKVCKLIKRKVAIDRRSIPYL